MKVELVEINADNWEDCIGLQVNGEQKDFVAPNCYSIVQAQFERSYVPMAAYWENTMVGFIMYGKDPEDGNYWVVRLMIDKAYQGRGLGRSTLMEGLQLITSKPDCSPVVITSFHPGNETASKLYESAGFVRNGQVIDGEIVMQLAVHGWKSS